MKNTISMKNREFKNIYKNGKSVANNLLILYTLESDLGNTNKLGICASKTVGNSIIRHRATRLIRESYRLIEHKAKLNRNIVVVARKNIVDKKCQDVQHSLYQLMNRMSLLQKD